MTTCIKLLSDSVEQCFENFRSYYFTMTSNREILPEHNIMNTYSHQSAIIIPMNTIVDNKTTKQKLARKKSFADWTMIENGDLANPHAYDYNMDHF